MAGSSKTGDDARVVRSPTLSVIYGFTGFKIVHTDPEEVMP
ncbi:hypothetical protein [Mycobacterium sp. NAZ190054]|nr:hypothetical protein [Mycobacterium sp. NAZ190054]